MAANAINLDHLLIRITATTPTRVAVAVLNHFISQNGRASRLRVASDYDYNQFRAWVVTNVGIIVTRALRVQGVENTLIGSLMSFNIVLTQVQSGVFDLPEDPQTQLRVLSLELDRDESADASSPSNTSRPGPSTPRSASRGSFRGAIRGGSRGGSRGNSRGGGRGGSSSIHPGNNVAGTTGNDDSSILPGSPAAASTPAHQAGSSKNNPQVLSSDNTTGSLDQASGSGNDDYTKGRELRPGEDRNEESGLAGGANATGQLDTTMQGQTILDDLDIDFGHINQDTWAEVCHFFNCDTAVRNVKISGIKPRIEDYQMHAIWLILVQITRKKASAMIGDDVGFGKTGMSISAMVIFHVIHEMWTGVSHEWSEGGSEDGVHLPEDHQNEHSKCPSQGDLDSGFICPCVKSGLSYRLATTMPSRPSLVFCPPDLIQNWMTEVDKWIDRDVSSLAENMRVSVYHGSYEGKPEYHNEALVNQLMAPTAQHVVTGTKASYTLETPDGQAYGARNIVIISRYLALRFLRMYDTKEDWHGPGARTTQLTVNHLMAGFVFFDEFHNYRGQRNSPTAPFEALERITSNSPGPVVAVGLSGSLRSSPANWRPFVNHLFYSARKHNWGVDMADMHQESDLDQHETDWDYLINHLHNPPEEGNKRAAFDARRDSLNTFLKDFIPSMMLCRTKGSSFRGRKIFQPADFQETAYNMGSEYIRAPFRELAQRVKAWCDDAFKVQHHRWREEGSPDDDEPVAVIVERGLLDEAARNPRKNMAFEIICHASTYPAVARLVLRRLISYDEMLVTNITPVANRVSSLLRANASRDEVHQALRESPWYRYRQQLRRESRKLDGVISQIDQLLRFKGLTAEHTDIKSLGPPPSDGTTIRHALVLSDSPLSVFLNFMHLYLNYISIRQVEFIYLHGGLSAAQRADLCQTIQIDCVPEDPVKVLIGSFQMAAEGYNLQRANYCILTEVPRRPDTQNQAFGRVDRKGQQMTPVLIQMYDNHNLAEMVRMIRNKNRAELAKIGHDVEEVNLNDFV